MSISLRFSWYAWYIGAFYSTNFKTLYIQFIPCVGIRISSIPKRNLKYFEDDLLDEEYYH